MVEARIVFLIAIIYPESDNDFVQRTYTGVKRLSKFRSDFRRVGGLIFYSRRKYYFFKEGINRHAAIHKKSKLLRCHLILFREIMAPKEKLELSDIKESR